MAKFDHHVHTSRHSPDSVIDPTTLIAQAKAAGLDGVVITEHDYQWEAGELADLRRRAGDLVVLSGAEVSSRDGHFLVYGLPDLSEAYPGISAKELVAVVRRHGGAIVAAHPYRWDQDFGQIARGCGGASAFDGLELVSNNVTPETRAKVEALLAESPTGVTGSSDGHEPRVVGCYYTEFPGAIASMAEFVAALRTRSGRPGHTAGRPRASGPVA